MAIETYQPSNSRSQLVEKNGNTIILDAYNANPSSMRVAIENFAKLTAADKILLLGGMAELGETSLREHEDLVALIDQHQWRDVVLVGGDFLKTKNRYKKFNNSKEAAEWLKNQHFVNTHMLVKGSRSMQMERVIE